MQRSELNSLLEKELTANTGWIRIHAAEGLLDHGQNQEVLKLFAAEADTAVAPYRIGVWRVLARASSGATRDKFVERIRAVVHDPQATDRISAAESLAKLDAAKRSDRETIQRWLTTADDAAAAFPRWVLVLSSEGSERRDDEAALVKLLNSPDAVARLRAAFALGRLKEISTSSVARLQQQLITEPTDSIARIYLITALLRHVKETSTIVQLESQLARYASGKPNEQLELGITIGQQGKPDGIALLKPLLNHSEPDARIGAATGLLHLLP